MAAGLCILFLSEPPRQQILCPCCRPQCHTSDEFSRYCFIGCVCPAVAKICPASRLSHRKFQASYVCQVGCLVQAVLQQAEQQVGCRRRSRAGVGGWRGKEEVSCAPGGLEAAV